MPPVDSWLRDHGWDVSAATFKELMARYGRSVPHGSEDSMPPTLYVSAQRTDSRSRLAGSASFGVASAAPVINTVTTPSTVAVRRASVDLRGRE
jgi:hypothetical protein